MLPPHVPFFFWYAGVWMLLVVFFIENLIHAVFSQAFHHLIVITRVFPITSMDLHCSALLAPGECGQYVESQPAIVRCHAFIHIVPFLIN